MKKIEISLKQWKQHHASIDGDPPPSHWLAPELSVAFPADSMKPNGGCWVRFEKIGLRSRRGKLYISPIAWKNLKPSCRWLFPQTWKSIYPIYIYIYIQFQLDLSWEKNIYFKFRNNVTPKKRQGGLVTELFPTEPSPQVMWISIELSYLVAGG